MEWLDRQDSSMLMGGRVDRFFSDLIIIQSMHLSGRINMSLNEL